MYRTTTLRHVGRPKYPHSALYSGLINASIKTKMLAVACSYVNEIVINEVDPAQNRLAPEPVDNA